MITEDQLEQLAIQWFQDTGGENIEHRTLNIERRSEEKRSLAEAVRRMGRHFRAWNPVGEGTQGAALGCRMMPRWGGYNSQGYLVS
jgi:hypothetical protein